MAGTRLYSSIKAFHFADRLREIELGSMPAPVHVRIKPTNRCNHSCWYCAYRADHMQLGENMAEADKIPDNKMSEIVDDLISMDVKAVTFSGGGEPLLYKALPETITRLGKGGIKVGCLTNGSNLKGRFADALATYGTWVRISIDAWDEESYSKARATGIGAFSKVIQNIRTFAGRDSACVLGASFIVGRANHQRVYEACQLLRRAGVQHVKLSAAVVSNDVSENNAYHAPLLATVQLQAERALELEGDDFRVINHYHTLGECFEKDYPYCPSMKLLTVIGADEMVYACQDKAYTEAGRLGSIKDTSFREFWFSEANQRRINGIIPRRDCRHHCVSHGKNTAIRDYLSLDKDHLPFV